MLVLIFNLYYLFTVGPRSAQIRPQINIPVTVMSAQSHTRPLRFSGPRGANVGSRGAYGPRGSAQGGNQPTNHRVTNNGAMRGLSPAGQRGVRSSQIRHPAPLPPAPPLQPSQPHWRAMPPKPCLKISRSGDGIVLSWKFNTQDLNNYEDIASYQLYAYQETNCPPSTDIWRKVSLFLLYPMKSYLNHMYL